MKLNIPQIQIIQQVLQHTGELGTDGRPVGKTYSVVDYSAMRWFFKSTKEFLDGHTDVVKKKRGELEKKYEKELKEQKEVMAKLNKLISEAEKPDKEFLQAVRKLLSEESYTKRIEKELGEDEGVVESFKKKREVEIKPKTMELIKREFENFQVSAVEDEYLSELIDEILEQ